MEVQRKSQSPSLYPKKLTFIYIIQKTIWKAQRDAKHLTNCARSMSSFPVDILTEIFLRLSSRPLVRLRCVCKSWNSLLTGPSFIKAYHHRVTKLQKFDLVKYELNKDSRVQIRSSPDGELADLDISFIEDGEKFKLIGSCNGIVCLSTFESKNHKPSKIFLWNPLTREKFALPQPSFHVSNFVGFGLNPSSGHIDDFKVVNVNIYSGKHPNYTSQVEVYSFRKKSWKQLGNTFPPSLLRPLGNQVIFESFICWCPYFYLNRERITLLLVFDVAKDDFREIELPDTMPPEEKHIVLLNGSLSLIAHNSSARHYELWIMKELGDCRSWTKLYTLQLSMTIATRYRPLGFANSGEVFFVRTMYTCGRFRSCNYLFLHNVKNEKFEAFEVKVDSYYSTQMVTCVESLICLSSTNDVEH